MAHIGTVIENALGWDRDIWSIPGHDLMAFGEVVREWAAAFDYGDGAVGGATYYGGWPSANLTSVGWDGLMSTALLMDQQVAGKDPISDWFCIQPGRRPRLLSARQGWLTDQGAPDVLATRHFLAMQLPLIRRLLPLLDADIVRLVPSEATLHSRQVDIGELASSIRGLVLTDPSALATQFEPQDIAVDDDRRGFFAFTGGNAEAQAERSLSQGIDYFAQEYVLARSCSANYTSVFPWEHHLVRSGLGQAVGPYMRTVDVLLGSKLPMFSGLSPEVIAKLHDDDAFGKFRSELDGIFGNCPTDASADEVAVYLHDREQTHLAPIIETAVQEVDRGVLRRVGLGLSGAGYSIAGTVAGAAIAGPASVPTAVAAILGVAVDAYRASKFTETTRLWSSLVRHERTVQGEIPTAKLSPAQGTMERGHPWGIASEPSQDILVTAGSVLWWQTKPPARDDAPTGYSEGVYALCPCGSGHKYKFCCASVPGSTPPEP